MRKPFFKASHNCWYFEPERGRHVRLDPDEEKAFDMWERLRQISDYRHRDATVEAVFEAWLEWFKQKASEERLEKAIYALSDFAKFVGPQSYARDICETNVLKWARKKRTKDKREYVWSLARQRDAIHFVKRAYKWAAERNWLPPSDVMSMRCESSLPRDTLVSRSEHEMCVLRTRRQFKRSRPFGLVLIALWHSGARPIQIRELTAKHVNKFGDWVFVKHKTSKKVKKPLVVRPSACLRTLVAILMHQRPEGPLFRSPTGNGWTKDGLDRRFRRMREDLGLSEDLKLYSYRHTFATDAIEQGINENTVAALLGHTSANMVRSVYSHIGKKDDPMREAADQLARKRG